MAHPPEHVSYIQSSRIPWVQRLEYRQKLSDGVVTISAGRLDPGRVAGPELTAGSQEAIAERETEERAQLDDLFRVRRRACFASLG